MLKDKLETLLKESYSVEEYQRSLFGYNYLLDNPYGLTKADSYRLAISFLLKDLKNKNLLKLVIDNWTMVDSVLCNMTHDYYNMARYADVVQEIIKLYHGEKVIILILDGYVNTLRCVDMLYDIENCNKEKLESHLEILKEMYGKPQGILEVYFDVVSKVFCNEYDVVSKVLKKVEKWMI